MVGIEVMAALLYAAPLTVAQLRAVPSMENLAAVITHARRS
jgi:hypothetical protein